MIKYRLIINDTIKISLQKGISYDENADETLDSVILTFAVKDYIEINNYDKIEIQIIQNGKIAKSIIQCVNQVDIDCKNYNMDDEVYFYTISATSMIKMLEKIPLPNLKITHSRESSKNKTIYEIANQYISTYSPKVRVANFNDQTNEPNYNIRNIYKLDSSAYNVLNIECPEFQWNEPTLREVLTDLFLVVNCLPICENGVIKLFELKENENHIFDKSKMNRKHITKNADEYASELTLSMSNAIGNNKVLVQEYIGFRNSSTYENTTNDLRLETQFPIYRIKSFKCYARVIGRNQSTGTLMEGPTFKEFNFTSSIYEKNNYDILKTPTIADTSYATTKWKKLYFERGKNIISGFSLTYNFLGEYLNITEMIKSAAGDSNIDYSLADNVLDIMFNVSYETESDFKLNVGKYLPSHRYDVRIADKQTNSLVNPKTMSFYEYAKANRIGNDIIQYNQTISPEIDLQNYDDVIFPIKSKTLNNEIVFKKKTIFETDAIFVEYYLTKDYILKDYYTGINSRIRNWQYLDSTESTRRFDVVKYYAVLSYSDYQYRRVQFSNQSPNIESYLLSCFGLIGQNINTAIVQTSYIDYEVNAGEVVSYPNDTQYYYLETSVEVLGYSIVVSFGFYDNFSAGLYLKLSNENDGGSSRLNDFYRYVNDYGEYDFISISLCSSLDQADKEFTWGNDEFYVDKEPRCSQAQWDRMVNKSRTKPLTSGYLRSENGVKYSLTKNIFKDNGETPKFAVQFEYCSDTSDIVIGQKFLEYQNFIKVKSTDSQYYYKFYLSEIAPSLNNLKLPENATLIDEAGFLTISDNALLYALKRDLEPANKYLYIVDDEGNVVISIKNKHGSLVGSSILRYQIFLNLLENRDINIYESENSRKIVGDIIDGKRELNI